MKFKNGDEYEIRSANVSDAKAMLEYLDTIAGESNNLTFGEGEVGITLESEENFISSTIDAKDKYFIVAVKDGEIIGNLNFSSGARPRLRHVGLLGVSVLKKYWGNGVASELIKDLIEWANNNDVITKLNLEVKEDNEKAIELYKKLGFEIEGKTSRSFYIDGKYYSSYYMGLELDIQYYDSKGCSVWEN